VIRPLFLLSPPRGGSTFVQRVLAADPRIATVSEPWLLLPLLYSKRGIGVRAEYWHEAAAQAVRDFCELLPAGRADYDAALRDLALELYGKVVDRDAVYFLDKTPHYHFVADEIAELFPEAKLVFLWRNPLAVVASFLETFRAGRWQPNFYMRDLETGYVNLVGAWERHRDRAHAVRYEDLVSGGDGAWRALFDYLELDFDPQLLTRFSALDIRGRFGDPTATRSSGSVHSASVDKWTRSVGSPIRKAWSRRYLARLGPGRLREMGYDQEELLSALHAAPSSLGGSPRDALDLSSSWLRQLVREAALRLPETVQPIGSAWEEPAPLPQRAARFARGVARVARRG
jgi:hypothetical protein